MTKNINISDAAKWLATMASADGVISHSERLLLKEFAETYGIDCGKLIRMAYAMAGNVDLPEVDLIDAATRKGRQFENFVVSLCSDKSRFKIISWRGDKIAGKTYAIDNLLPDLHISHRLNDSTVQYLIECKFRSSWGKDGIDLSRQLSRYRIAAYKNGLELFFAIGIGGMPSDPDEFLIVPAHMIGTDKRIDRDRFINCIIEKDSVAFHNYIAGHFNTYVL